MLIHLNGQLVEASEARVSVFDRGFLFGDGVYEGLRTTADSGGRARVIGATLHNERLREGLAEARIRGFDAADMTPLTEELVKACGLVEAFVYWQITRGTPMGPAGPERPRVVKGDVTPTVVGFATPVASVRSCVIPDCRRVSLRPDTRWTRGHLKSISLLGGVLAALEADEAGNDDAIMERDGVVSEGTATNVFLSIGGRLVTPSLESAPMLAGVTRALLLEADASIEVRPVTVDELMRADEVMLVGTKSMVASVVAIDGKPVGGAAARGMKAGPEATKLLAALVRAIGHEVEQQRAGAKVGTQAATLTQEVSRG